GQVELGRIDHHAGPESDAIYFRTVASSHGGERRGVKLTLGHRFPFEDVHELAERGDASRRLADLFLRAREGSSGKRSKSSQRAPAGAVPHEKRVLTSV